MRTVNGSEDQRLRRVSANSVYNVKSLIETVTQLASHKDCKQSASYFDEITRSQSEVGVKENELTAHKTVIATLANE